MSTSVKRHRAWMVVWWVIFVGIGITGVNVVFRRDRDLSVFLRGAERLLQGQWITVVETHHFTYPPFFALLMTPFTALPLTAAKLLWCGLGLLLLFGISRATCRLALDADALEEDAAPFIRAVTLIICLHVTLAVFQTQQFDLVVFAAALGGVWLLVRDRWAFGGAALGLAAALKVTPALFLPYLLLKRQWRAAGSMALVMIALSLLPDLLFAPPSGLYLSDWFTKIVFPGTHAPGGGTNPLNQALGVMVFRVFGAGSDSPFALFGLSGWPFTLLKAVILSLVALPIIRARPWRQPLQATPRPTRTAEMSLVFCLMLLWSPMSSKAHFVALLLPCALLVARVYRTWTPRARVYLGLLFAAGVLTGRDVVGVSASNTFFHAGVITWVALAIYLSNCRRLRSTP